MSDLDPIDGVGLDDFLLAKARLDHAPGEMPAVLATLSLRDAEAWRRVERTWRERLDADEQLGDVAGRFLATYAKQVRGTVEEIAQVEEAAPLGPVVEPAVVAPTHQVPSFMHAPLAMAPPPVVVAPPAPVPAPVVPAPVAPFPAPAVPPAPLPVAGHPPLARLAVAPPAVAPAAPAAPAPGLMRVPLAQRGTSPVDLERMREIMNSAPTPFVGKTSAERLDELRADAPKSEPATPASRGSNVTMMGTLEPGAPGRTLPFAKDGGGASFPDLTVDRYAALAAELQAKGPTSSVLARYEITTSAALLALHAGYERRFASNAQLRTRFEERKAHFLAFMAPTR